MLCEASASAAARSRAPRAPQQTALFARPSHLCPFASSAVGPGAPARGIGHDSARGDQQRRDFDDVGAWVHFDSSLLSDRDRCSTERRSLSARPGVELPRGGRRRLRPLSPSRPRIAPGGLPRLLRGRNGSAGRAMAARGVFPGVCREWRGGRDSNPRGCSLQLTPATPTRSARSHFRRRLTPRWRRCNHAGSMRR